MFRPVSVPLYADLDKRANDVLTKEFPSEKEEKKVVWKGTTIDGVVFDTTLTQKKDGSNFGTFSSKYRHRPWGTTFSMDLNTQSELKAEAKVDDVAGIDGFSAAITVHENAPKKASDGQEIFAGLGLEYHHENVTATTNIDFGKAEGSTAKASVVVGAQGMLIGASARYHVGVSELKELNTTLAYQKLDYDFIFYGKLTNEDGKSDTHAGLKYVHKVNADLTVAADLNADVNNLSKNPKLTVSSIYTPDSSASFKSKFDTTGKLGLSYTQKLSNNVRLTLSSTTDANNWGSKNSASFGFSINFTY